MSTPPRGLQSGQNPAWALAFWNRVHRYRCLVRKFWWVLVLTLSTAILGASWYQMTRPPLYLSAATYTVDANGGAVKIGDGPNNSAFTQGADEYLQTQTDLLTKGSAIRQAAVDYLQAKYPELTVAPVKLDVTSRNSILTIAAMGPNPAYTERYLQAIVKAYQDYRRKQITDSNKDPLIAISEQIPVMREKLEKDDQAIIQYQRDNKIVFDKDDANNANGKLAALRLKVTTLEDQTNQLKLMTPEEGLTRAQNVRGGSTSTGTTPGMGAISVGEGDYRQAKSQLESLKSQRDDFAHDLRPAHPIMLRLESQINAQQRIIDSLLADSRKQIRQQHDLYASMLQAAKAEIEPAEREAFNAKLLRVEYDRLVAVKALDLKQFEELESALRKGNTVGIQTDKIHLSDPPSPAELVPASWVKILLCALVGGLAAGVGVLALIDRMDDRMGSISDFQLHFSETVLGQIPRDDSADETELLRPDDQRHMLVESFRNLRSTLLYMPLEGARPKTLLITSAVPNEGKSTLSSNLALVLAFAGMKTLLIDADLRRGAIHESFGVTRTPGLTDVLGHNVNWKIAIRTTGIENLHVLPRGRNVPQPSEYLLNKNTDHLLKELYPLYDYIIIDSSPVLAADDTASLAPKIDATLFVCRMSFTSAKMTRKSLEILYGRQANIPGLILNQVDTTSPEFVYYQYSEYYYAAQGEEEPGTGGAAAEGSAKPPTPTKPAVEV